MKKVLVIIVLFAVFCVHPFFLRAQSSDAPLILLMRGDFWALNEGDTTPTRLTNWGCSKSPSLSPDGKRIAYVTLPEAHINGEGSTCEPYSGASSPTNIRVLDIGTGESQVIAEQSTAYFDQTSNGVWDIRSQPAWSSDGSMLAWINLPFGVDNAKTQLVIYDFKLNSTKTVETDIPDQCAYGYILLPIIFWGNNGLVVYSNSCVFDDKGGIREGEDVFFIYSKDGLLISSQPLAQQRFAYLTEEGTNIDVFQQGHDRIAIAYSAGDLIWLLFDLQTGQILPTNGNLELYSAFASNQSLGISTIQPDSSFFEDLVVSDSTGKQVLRFPSMGYDMLDQMTLSPDGQAVAYITREGDPPYKALNIWWADQKAIHIPVDGISLWLIWGPTAWRIRPDLPAPPVENFACLGTVKSRLVSGGNGIVLPGKDQNLYQAFSPDTTLLGQIPAGETFLVGRGPFCIDGQVWWEVYYKNYFGWTVEGRGRYYYLEPVS